MKFNQQQVIVGSWSLGLLNIILSGVVKLVELRSAMVWPILACSYFIMSLKT